MPYDLKEIAAISGMPGLYRLVKPTRAGVIIESLDERAARSVASARNKVSLLQEISIYTQDYDRTVPLSEVFDRIYQKHGQELALTNKSDDRDLTAFMGDIVPDYDRQRVYMSDIKKLVQWYHAVSRRLDYQAPAPEEETTPAAPEAASAATEPTASVQVETPAPKPTKKTTKKSAEAPEAEAAPAAAAPKSRKKPAAETAAEPPAEKPAKKSAAKKKE